MDNDFIFKTENFIFSYRVAGVLIREGKILLQKPVGDDGFSLPGGHVSFGETSDRTLVREFREEINADIRVEKLILVGENFFLWGEKTCQQISLYYTVSLLDTAQIPLDGTFRAVDELQNERIDLDFSWIPLRDVEKIKVYPENITQYLLSVPEHPVHFVYRGAP